MRRKVHRASGGDGLVSLQSRSGGMAMNEAAMARRIPPGVGPKYPQVVVLVGATGNLSQRKLLPGLFHLMSAGFIPRCRIIGLSLDDIDLEKFRQMARSALDRFGTRKVVES